MSLSRRALLAGAAVLTLPLPIFAQPRRYGLQPVEVADGIWMIVGRREVFTRENGGDIVNVALLATDQGALVVDSGSTAAMGAEIRAFADQRLGGLVATINTHHHPDHWFGNAPLADRPVLALAATSATCRENAQDYAETLYSILGSWISGTRTMPATGEVEAGPRAIGGRTLRMIPLAGHTAADLAILDEATGVLVAGDLVFLDRATSLPDADFATWLAALDRLEGLGPAGVVPGHGRFHRAGEGIAQTRAYLRATRDRLAMAADLGLTPIEAMAAGPVPEFAGLGANPEEYLRSVVRRFGDHETLALPVVGGA
ncbi:quinoprotein relay system zinc metallohydrolase 1 [Paracoccus pantotrophus]|nr:quinoprotein relay system zinc metallohydrolase 1 [Paracoccus pantotrophus]